MLASNFGGVLSCQIFRLAWGRGSISFLNVQVSLREGSPFDRLLLHATRKSCNPWHTKKAIPYGQALRLRRTCSENLQFQKRVGELAGWPKDRGYEESLDNEQRDTIC